MPDGEVSLMMRTLADNLSSYDQIVEVSLPEFSWYAPNCH